MLVVEIARILREHFIKGKTIKESRGCRADHLLPTAP
ncbi:hypothetical protein ACVWWG_000322 [Bradyrhizobium sp. LB7.2]|jgi:hypothetical protein